MFNDQNAASAVEAVARLARESVSPVVKIPGVAPFAVIPAGCDLQTLPEEHRFAARPTGAVRLFDVQSLADYAIRVAGDDSPVVYVDTRARRVVAIFNDHDGALCAGWRDWRATIEFQVAPQLAAWLMQHGRAVDQTTFAEFIENRIGDILSPAGVDFLPMICDFQSNRNATFRSSVRLADGSTQFQYVNEASNAGGQTVLPASIQIWAPILAGCAPVAIGVRIRHRVDKSLSLWVEIPNHDELIDAAVAEQVAELAQMLPNATIVRGQP